MSQMAYFNLAVAFFILISMALMLIRLLWGPTLYDRVLAVNSFGTKTVLFLCVFCFIIGRPDGIDIAILYALMNFIATIAILKFFRYRALDLSIASSELGETPSALAASQAKTSKPKASKSKPSNSGRTKK